VQVAALVVAILVAHAGTAVQQSDYAPRLVGLQPAVEGVDARLVDAGTRIELDAGDHEIVVLGYQGEPFLLIDEGGVFENGLSPSTYLNRSLDGDAIPDEADANADPRWDHLHDGDVARWHDHALHVPPGQELGERTTSTFRIPMRIDGRETFLVGQMVTLPASSALPWMAIAALLAVLAIVSLRRSSVRVTVALVGVLLAADAVRVYATAFGVPSWIVSRGEVLREEWLSIVIGWVLLGAALVLHARRRRFEAAAASFVGAAVVAIRGGAMEVDDLTARRLVAALPGWSARLAIAVVLGLGLGVALRSLLELTHRRMTPAMRAPRTGSEPSPADGTRTASPSPPPSG
jgi:hypothetical protein